MSTVEQPQKLYFKSCNKTSQKYFYYHVGDKSEKFENNTQYNKTVLQTLQRLLQTIINGLPYTLKSDFSIYLKGKIALSSDESISPKVETLNR